MDNLNVMTKYEFEQGENDVYIAEVFEDCVRQVEYPVEPVERFTTLTFRKEPHEIATVFNEINSVVGKHTIDREWKCYDYMKKNIENKKCYMVKIFINPDNIKNQVIMESSCDFMTIRSTSSFIIEKIMLACWAGD